MGQKRLQRVAEVIRQVIAGLFTDGLKDPRIGFVSVLSVEMSNDLRYANVYVSLYGDESQRKGSLAGLRSSAGWIRREIGKQVKLQYTPEIRFLEDTSLDRVFRLDKIFRELHDEEGGVKDDEG